LCEISPRCLYAVNFRSLDHFLLKLSRSHGMHHLAGLWQLWPLTSRSRKVEIKISHSWWSNSSKIFPRCIYVVNFRSLNDFLLKLSRWHGMHHLAGLWQLWPLTSRSRKVEIKISHSWWSNLSEIFPRCTYAVNFRSLDQFLLKISHWHH
jgi:ribosome-associated toxin RatA of RatAB toxin-antitoxin module